ncbi:MAG TPA: alpha/beta fold hydrolase [Candidatus Acidoferrum sp.]|nr:alpha/beta fold hydrolase [Candidatus Acidoferrum sp.]
MSYLAERLEPMIRLKKMLLITAMLSLACAVAAFAQQPAAAPGITGTWLGTLDTGALKLRIQFHIISGPTGLTATMDSLDQGARGIPTNSVTLNGSTLHLEVPSAAGKYEGQLDAAGATITGTWSQGGGSLPLVLHRSAEEAAPLRRPQTPQKPYPYYEEDVTYSNAAAGITLAATLTIPQGKGPFPAILLICGSGPHDRDETIFEHKPFLVLADYLTRKGFVVLRADKRGNGKSGGVYATATTADFATDAEAGVAFLRTRAEVNRAKIGLLGHSEGGAIAPMVAAHDPAIAFIVLMAGPGVPGDQILIAQRSLIEEAQGAPKDFIEKDAAVHRLLFDAIEQEKDKDSATVEKDVVAKFTGQIPDAQLAAEAKVETSPWFRYFLSYDPATSLRLVKCPVLAIDGSKDLQVPPELDLAAIRKALESGGNKHVETDELAGLNHLFQTANTGAPTEYADIEETIAPVALEKIGSWLLKQ